MPVLVGFAVAGFYVSSLRVRLANRFRRLSCVCLFPRHFFFFSQFSQAWSIASKEQSTQHSFLCKNVTDRKIATLLLLILPSSLLLLFSPSVHPLTNEDD